MRRVISLLGLLVLIAVFSGMSVPGASAAGLGWAQALPDRGAGSGRR
jgi:hypothetical protein